MATKHRRSRKHRTSKFQKKYAPVFLLLLAIIIASAIFALLFVRGGRLAFFVAAAPGPVLAVSSPTDSSALLAWLVPGDGILDYDFRLSNKSITAANFGDAMPIAPSPSPGAVASSWQKLSGTALISAGAYNLTDAKASVVLAQQLFPITYEWRLKLNDTGASASLHLLSDEELSQGYMLTVDSAGITIYRSDDSGLSYVYRDELISLEKPGLLYSPATAIAPNIFGNYKLVYNYNEESGAGEFRLFFNNAQVATATDSYPFTSGNYLGLSTAGRAFFDDIKVTQGNDTFLWAFDSSTATTQQYTVKGLEPGKSYYFAMKYQSQTDNLWSPISNSPSIATLACSSGKTQSCYTGPAGTQNIGECRAGTQTCSNGLWGNCTGSILPQTETCDKKDNDCDGAVDENFDKDDDEYFDASCASVYSKTDCNDTDEDIHPGAHEYCDEIDNDCNGAIDDSCGIPGQLAEAVLGDSICSRSLGETSENACRDCGCPSGKICANNACITNVSAESCICDSWFASGFCGDSPCSSMQKLLTRACTPRNCQIESQCQEELECAPPTKEPYCGDNVQDTGEDCDGISAIQCPGHCSSSCTCLFRIGDGVCQKAEGETAENSPEDCKKKASMALILVIVLLAIFGAVMGAYFFAIRPRQQLGNLAELQGIGNPEEASKSDAEAFANTGLAEGFSLDQIKNTLTDTGWEEKTASSAVGKAEKAQDRLGLLAEKHELSSGDADRAKGYIDACTKSGFTPTQVKSAMISAGWKAEDVESLLAKNPNIKSGLSEAKQKAAKLGEADLKPYISDQLNSGFTPDQIKLALKKAGWKDDEVERAFAG